MKFFMHAAAYLNSFEMSCEIAHKRPGSEFGAINKKGEEQRELEKGNFVVCILSFLFISDTFPFWSFQMLCIFM